jgi:hypothetical protein
VKNKTDVEEMTWGRDIWKRHRKGDGGKEADENR